MTSRSAMDRRKWEELYASGSRPDRPPSAWVVDTLRRLPNDLLLLDVAGGTGRHAAHAARPGRTVVVADIALQAVAAARAAHPAIVGSVADASSLPFRPGSFGIVMVVNFLDRSIFPDLISLLAPGGHLVYETYTLAHLDLVQRGLARGPHSRDYVLRPGELSSLVQPLKAIEYWEGEVEDEAGRRCCARLVAQSGKRKAQSAE
jgi:SAM-dependent methyltransferase